jgi:hypothetical protein
MFKHGKTDILSPQNLLLLTTKLLKSFVKLTTIHTHQVLTT